MNKHEKTIAESYLMASEMFLQTFIQQSQSTKISITMSNEQHSDFSIDIFDKQFYIVITIRKGNCGIDQSSYYVDFNKPEVVAEMLHLFLFYNLPPNTDADLAGYEKADDGYEGEENWHE